MRVCSVIALISTRSPLPLALATPGQFLEQLAIRREGERGVRSHGHDQIEPGGELRQIEPERLPEHPLHSVAGDCVPDASSHAEPEARVAQVVRQAEDDERSAGLAHFGAVDRLELASVPEPMARPEDQPVVIAVFGCLRTHTRAYGLYGLGTAGGSSP